MDGVLIWSGSQAGRFGILKLHVLALLDDPEYPLFVNRSPAWANWCASARSGAFLPALR